MWVVVAGKCICDMGETKYTGERSGSRLGGSRSATRALSLALMRFLENSSRPYSQAILGVQGNTF